MELHGRVGRNYGDGVHTAGSQDGELPDSPGSPAAIAEYELGNALLAFEGGMGENDRLVDAVHLFHFYAGRGIVKVLGNVGHRSLLGGVGVLRCGLFQEIQRIGLANRIIAGKGAFQSGGVGGSAAGQLRSHGTAQGSTGIIDLHLVRSGPVEVNLALVIGQQEGFGLGVLFCLGGFHRHRPYFFSLRLLLLLRGRKFHFLGAGKKGQGGKGRAYVQFSTHTISPPIRQ